MIIMVNMMTIMMTWIIWCSFNQSKIDGRSFWEAFLEWRTICTWSFLFSLPIICFLQWSFLFSDGDEALAATKERLICDVCGNVVGANICNSSILIYITERSDDDNQTWNLSKNLHRRIFRLKILHRHFHLISTVLVGKNTKKWVKMEKFTPLAKILHCRRHWRDGQIPP